ncbi:hypothetical protein [Streptomyces cadmiisoli]|uniref:hypothetical protein n=1 Tax=Streptomyces cadmiisoli TaxID=2184053 RepID=UPI00364845B0
MPTRPATLPGTGRRRGVGGRRRSRIRHALNHQPEQARAALADADALMERLAEGERSDT